MELKKRTGYNEEKIIKYPKRIFLFDRDDYKKILNYLDEIAPDKKEVIGITFYFLDEEKTKIIKANIVKKTLDFTGNINEDFFNELEKKIMK